LKFHLHDKVYITHNTVNLMGKRNGPLMSVRTTGCIKGGGDGGLIGTASGLCLGS